MSKKSVHTGRRGFLKGLAVAGSGAAVAGLAGSVQGSPELDVRHSDEQPAETGYRVTDHVRRYYEKARF